MWTIKVHPAFEGWLQSQNADDRNSIAAAIAVIRDRGPSLGRPLVDSVKGSVIHNLKELRPPSGGRSEIRILFAFDFERNALFLVGGDKSTNWRGWYSAAIREAEERWFELNGEKG